MVAVTDGTGVGSGPRQPYLPVPELRATDRVVAVALRPLDLLRPGSELARLLAGRKSADLLLVCDDEPGAGGVPAGGEGRVEGVAAVPPRADTMAAGNAGAAEVVDRDAVERETHGAPGRNGAPENLVVIDRDGSVDERHDRGPDERGCDDEGRWDDESLWDDESPWDDEDSWDDEGEGDDEEPDGLGEAIDGLGLGELRVHRLGLRLPVGRAAEDDVVAALSELVGFDPEAGVYCVAPSPEPPDPERDVVVAAAHRIARVYGLPLLRYRSA